MGFVACGVPTGLESREVETQDGTFERVYFHLGHPMSKDDQYADIFKVGGKHAEIVREAAAAGRVIEAFVRFKKNKETHNGSDVWVWPVADAVGVE